MEKDLIARGHDYLTTLRAEQFVWMTPELLGKGAEPFGELVTLVGAALVPAIGNADTIMERMEDAVPGKPVRTRIAAFANMSAAPIRIRGDSAVAGWYDLYVTLSPGQESPGEAVYEWEDEYGGTFASKVDFWPLFELRPLGSGPSIFVDTATQDVPGFPMTIGSSGGRWSRRPPTRYAVTDFRAEPFFYEGEVLIVPDRSREIEPVPPATVSDLLKQGCAKVQAEFIDREYGGQYARRQLGITKPDANRERG